MWFLLLFINCFFAYMAEKYFEREKQRCIFFLFLIVFFNVFFIGLRSSDVGIDSSYIPIYFDYARNIDDILEESDFDKGFLLLAYLARLVGDDSQVLMVFTEFIIIFFVVLGIYELKKTIKCSIFWFILLFMFLYQEQSFNIMRQYCAMSIVFYGFSLWVQKRYYSYLICQIVGYFFHSTSIIFILVPLCHWFSYKDEKYRYLYAIGSILFLSFLLLSYYSFLAYIESLQVLKESYYETYGLGSRFTSEDGTYSPRAIVIFIVEVLLCYFLSKKKNVSDDVIYMLLMLSVINLLLIEMKTVMEYFYRLSYYVGFVLIVYISGIFENKRLEVSLLLLAYLILVVQGSFYFYDNDSLKALKCIYKSKILGI